MSIAITGTYHRQKDESLSVCRLLLIQLYGKLQPANAEPLSIEALATVIDNHLHGWHIDAATMNSEVRLDEMETNGIKLNRMSYDIIGISMPQGTYELGTKLLDEFASMEPHERPYIVVGHAIPTYAFTEILEKWPFVIVVRGWGELPFLKLAANLHSGRPISYNVPNISYISDGKLVSNEWSIDNYTVSPWRIAPEKYFSRVETSRGCHFGACTFCTRPPGKNDFWQRIPLNQIADSIKELRKKGVEYFTFADEDFIGNDLSGAMEIGKMIEAIGGLKFSISVRADNIINSRDNAADQVFRQNVLGVLRDAGWALSFIGVESLSDSQLRRYGKGVTAAESASAVRVVRDLGIDVEMGFILFDPMVSLEELRENAVALRNSGLWKYVGHLFSYMRAQRGTTYARKLANKNLLGNFDIDMLSYSWSFQDPLIERIASMCVAWSEEFANLYRSLRNVERTSTYGHILTPYIENYRLIELAFLESILDQASDTKRNNGEQRDIYIAEDINRRRDHLVGNLLAVVKHLSGDDFALRLLKGLLRDFEASSRM